MSLHNLYSEFFVEKPERAKDIVSCFNSGNCSSYEKFKKNVADSDILEYTEAKKLNKNGSLNVESILSKL